jgi:hypothetical protein
MKIIGVHLLAAVALPVLDSVSSFQPPSPRQTIFDSSLSVLSRRDWLAGTSAALAFTFTSVVDQAWADEPAILAPLEMKEFVDPQGLFALSVPKNFYTLRRTQKGDLPDAKTGKGRRGSSIFTAGNLAKAEVVAVERYVTGLRVLRSFSNLFPNAAWGTLKDTRPECFWKRMELNQPAI